jgi:hypothetical protein
MWFLGKHVGDVFASYDNHVPMILSIHVLCVAITIMEFFPFICLVCKHNAILDIFCHECSHFIMLVLPITS